MTEKNNNNENHLPKDWKWVKLGEVCDKVSLNKIKIKQKEYLEEGLFPVVDQGQDLIGGYYNDKNLLIPHEPPYVVFGDHTKAKKFINFKFIAGADGVKVLKAKENIDSKFLYYSLFTIKIEDKGYARHFQLLEKELFPLPPKPTQQAIVSKIEELFSELDKGIENLRFAQQQLKTYRQSVLKWAFEGKLSESGLARLKDEQDLVNKEILRSSNSENPDSDKGELPKGWKHVSITELAEKNKNALKAGPFGSSLKKEFYVEKGYKIYGQEQVISGDPFYGNYYINEQKYQELNSCKIKPFDILISLVGTVGKVLLLPQNCEPGIINPRLIKISLDTKVYLPKFFKSYFESSIVKSFYSGETRGTTMDVLNLGIIKTIPFPLCSIHEQQEIIEAIESRLSIADKMEETITQSLEQAEALRQSILKKAFEGRLI